jgi:hypothetical protein
MTPDLDKLAASAFDDPPEDINSKNTSEQKRHARAKLALTDGRGAQAHLVDTVQDTPHPRLGVLHALASIPGLSQRDSAMVYLIVLLRLLAHGQLKELAFPQQDGSVLRRCAGRLNTTGWITRWDAAKQHGGLERYLHPTPKALSWAFEQFTAGTASEPWAPLVRLMQPEKRRPLALMAGARPKWLAHQREVNSLVTRTVISGAHPIAWASTWEAPFPTSFGIVKLPQPDYVLVEKRDGVPHLVFGEHDRGTELLETFVSRKVELYAGLAMFPEVCEQLFGLSTFEVRVSVIDTRNRNPMARLRALAESAATTTARMRFTLGGSLHAHPAEAIWYSRGTLSTPNSTGEDSESCSLVFDRAKTS